MVFLTGVTHSEHVGYVACEHSGVTAIAKDAMTVRVVCSCGWQSRNVRAPSGTYYQNEVVFPAMNRRFFDEVFQLLWEHHVLNAESEKRIKRSLVREALSARSECPMCGTESCDHYPHGVE